MFYLYPSVYINDLNMFGQALILRETEDANQILSEYCRNGECVKITLFRREREKSSVVMTTTEFSRISWECENIGHACCRTRTLLRKEGACFLHLVLGGAITRLQWFSTADDFQFLSLT